MVVIGFVLDLVFGLVVGLLSGGFNGGLMFGFGGARLVWCVVLLAFGLVARFDNVVTPRYQPTTPNQ